MTEKAGVNEIFSSFQQYINEEYDIKEEIRSCVRNLEQIAREILTTLQAIHQPEGIKQIPTICGTAREMLSKVKEMFQELSAKIPENQYYRFHDHWKFAVQRLVFITSLIVYLETEELVKHSQSAEMLGVSVARSHESGFHIDLDDFLIGLLQLASELSRLAVNSVIAEDYGRPSKIAKFVGELDSGFRLLNLKNDALRKRFDALKYDMKKIEEVVYDVKIRGLEPKKE